MTGFEYLYVAAEPFLPPLHSLVRRQLKRAAGLVPRTPEILDVGGRKSHYTIGVPGRITVTDLPRETEVQKQLHLGVDPEIVAQTKSRRSNIREILLDDMTRSKLPDRSFDIVVAVEVLEHVEEDGRFIWEVCRILRSNGMFLMTTPNGDSVPNITNPDHKRHYTREQLQALLSARFDEVQIAYAIKSGRFRSLGLRSWSIRRPLTTVLSMASNVINAIESAGPALRDQAVGTRHLVAQARKRG